MYRWILYRIPLAVYILILTWMFLIHPAGALIVAGMSLVIMVPWLIFARWVCDRIDASDKFNHRK
ncbi:MAG: hypothetical protein ACLVEV_03795 [Lachnospiraceae bacterium]|uniref:hypothetical protein n=1 Tax=Parablautia sp. Marseille-Q6255 TaxID=3039593 RepID=UPI0024BD01DC|nr:hypothetical protein [Parablautia sp. Marseille-Q6255]